MEGSSWTIVTMVEPVVLKQSMVDADEALDVQLSSIFKAFDKDIAVKDVNLDVKHGEFFSILGPSGSGKSTTLRLIAGFEEPTAGDVRICGQLMTHVPAYRRPVNTVFQSYALFNHMTVWENIAFGLRIQKLSKANIYDRVQQGLQLVKMERFGSRYPMQLSGGQQQRVALARALVNRPSVVLLDEPLGALDLKLRKEMQVELVNLHQELGITFVLVTHDQEEALSLSDRIAVMNHGQIEQVDVPHLIYDYPQTPFVADFIGDTNLFQGCVVRADYSTLDVSTTRGLRIVVRSPNGWGGSRPEREVVVSVRPEKICLSQSHPGECSNCFEGRLETIMYLGTHVHYVVELLSGDRLKVMQPSARTDAPELYTSVYAYWRDKDCLALTVSQ